MGIGMTQQIIVGILIALSVLYMLRRFVFKKKKTGGASSSCGSCNGCSSASKPGSGSGCH